MRKQLPRAPPGLGSYHLRDNENPVFLREVSTPLVMPAESSAFRIKSCRCSSSFVTDSLMPGPKKGNELAGLCENNKMLFFQNSWLRTHCPECSGVQRSFLFPALRGAKNSSSGLAPLNKAQGSPPSTDTASMVTATLTAWNNWDLRDSGGQKAAKILKHVRAYISQSRLIRSGRFCNEKER